MLIGVRNRFIFVANTKAASTSIEQAFAPHAEIQRGGTPARKHVQMRQAARIYNFLFRQPGMEVNTFFKFVVIRDPLDWITSWYRYRIGNPVEAELDPRTSFADFWKRADWNVRRSDGTPFLQRDMVCGPKGGLQVNYIVRYDDLEAEIALLSSELRFEVDVPRLNVSRVGRNEVKIPRALEAELRDYYAPDYELLARAEDVNARGLRHLRWTLDRRTKGPV